MAKDNSYGTDVVVTKPMYNEAVTGLGKCNKCVEKLAIFKELGFPQEDIEQRVNEWRPRLEGIIAQYDSQMGK